MKTRDVVISLLLLFITVNMVVGLLGVHNKPKESNWDIELAYSLCVSKNMIPLQDRTTLAIRCVDIKYGDKQ